MERDFDYGGKKFKLNKIDPFKQFHIVRRIGPILSDILPAMKDAQRFQEVEKMSQGQQLEMISKFASPIMNGLSKLSDADAELVLLGLLQAVEMQQAAGNWARIATSTLLMFQDLELPAMLHLASRAFMYNLANFFAGLPQ